VPVLKLVCPRNFREKSAKNLLEDETLLAWGA